MPIRINIRIVAVVAFAGSLALTAAHFGLASRDWPGWRLFDLDAEGGLGTAFAATLGLASASVSLVAGLMARRRGDPWVWWMILGFGLFLYAIDEVARVHEGLSQVVSGSSLGGSTGDPMAGTAEIGLLVLPLFAVVMVRIFRSADRLSSALIVLGLGIFWLGAFGFERLEYLSATGQLFITQGMGVERGDALLTGLQEFLEMMGISIVLVGALRSLAVSGASVVFHILGAPAASHVSLEINDGLELADEDPKVAVPSS